MKIDGSTILVTGGAGFIGSHIVESLINRGAKVKIYDNFSSGTLENLDWCIRREMGNKVVFTPTDSLEIINGNILNYNTLKRAIAGCDIVSHQAAQLEITRSIDDPVYDMRINIEGTLNVMKAAAANGVKKVIQASSACVYGQAQYVPQDEDHPTNPNWPYGVSKLAAEKYAQLYGQIYGIPVVSLRYAIVYGPREWYGRVLTIFLKRILDGKPPVVFGQGRQLRDFTYVSDLVDMHNLCIENSRANDQIFNVGTGHATSIDELAYLTCRDVIVEDIKEGERSALVEGQRMRLPNELKKMVLDPGKAFRILGWTPKVTLEDGIYKEWDWLVNNSHRWKTMSY